MRYARTINVVVSAAATGGAWTPQRDAAGVITNFDALPARTWTEIPGSAMEVTIKPILDAGGYTLYQYGSNKLSAVMDNYNGMAWDMPGGRGWASGGGHEGGSDNGVYGIDLNKMAWSITAYPSHPVNDLTPQQARMYGAGSRRAGDSGGTQNTDVYALANSSTGFAIKYHASFSILAWWAVTGPERYVTPSSVVFANGDTWSKAGSHLPLEVAFPLLPNIADVLFDGRPASRHEYGGFLYSPTADALLSVVRSYWKCKLDGTGWVKLQDGGGKPATQSSGEMIWAHVDEKTGKVWWGGCGSGCSEKNYYLYSQGYIVDPVTLTDTPTPPLLSDNRPPAGGGALNAGDHNWIGYKIGRKIGGWCMGDETKPLPRDFYGWNCDMDTGVRQLLRWVGAPFTAKTGEGHANIYIPHLGQQWVFNCYDRSLPAWSLDIDSPKAGGPNGALDITARIEVLTNAAALPSNVNGLVYTRLSYWPAKKLIVYCPATAQNVWVCRV